MQTKTVSPHQKVIQQWALLVIGLIFGGTIGFVLAAGNGIDLSGHDHNDPSQHHQHSAMVEVITIPSLQVQLSPDPVSGHNVKLSVQNFTFAPDHAGLTHQDGQGHAHLSVDGHKIARLYGEWYHLEALPTGEYILKVELSSNDHRILAQNGVAIAETLTLQVP